MGFFKIKPKNHCGSKRFRVEARHGVALKGLLERYFKKSIIQIETNCQTDSSAKQTISRNCGKSTRSSRSFIVPKKFLKIFQKK